VLKRGVDAAPTVRELSLALGGVCLDRADSANAKVAFAIAIAPGDPDALMGFGIALHTRGISPAPPSGSGGSWRAIPITRAPA